MIKKITLVLLLLLSLSSYSQSLDWGINMGGHLSEYPNDLHKVPGGLILSSTLEGLRKYDFDGNLLWSFSFFNNVDQGFSIYSSDVDEKGNIYVAMGISGSYGTMTTINGFEFLAGTNNLVKIDPQGELVWVRFIGGSNVLVKYANRSVFVTGSFLESISINNEVDLESTQYNNCYSGVSRYGGDIFLARFSDIGVLEKAVQYGNPYHDYPAAMELDEDGDLFIAGMHQEYGCVTSFSYLLRYDKDLKQVWEKKITTEERDEYLLYPTNLFLSENGNLYLVTRGFYGIDNDEYQIPDFQEWTYNLMEYDKVTGDFLRLNAYPKGNWNESFVPPSPYLNNMYIQDYREDLLVFTSANQPLTFTNRDFVPQEHQENLLLFKVSKRDFTSTYVTHFEAEIPDIPDYAAIDNPGRTLVDGNSLFLTAAFQSSPLHVLGTAIPNNSGNNDRDILLARIDLSALADPEGDMDDDGDGVLNFADYCSDTPAGMTVNVHGCTELQEDLDLDGVLNRRDKCPNTRPGKPVSDRGCEILPVDNFRVSAISETCVRGKDAAIRITAEDNSFQYFAYLNDNRNPLPFTDVAEFTNLWSGTYTICITAEGAEFDKCFELVIESPKGLEVYSSVDNLNHVLELELRGGENYTIVHNRRVITTTEEKIELPLHKGVNQISVNTEKSCQGIFEKVILNGTGSLLHPNPVEDHFNLDFYPKPEGPVTIEILSMKGQVLKTESVTAGAESIKVNASGLSQGSYLVRVTSNTGFETFKILKK